MAFADVDLDPAAEQKLNLVRLLGRFPDVEDDYGEQPDLRAGGDRPVGPGHRPGGRRVEEWVGDRVGIGLSWDAAARALTPVAALQTTDGEEALADLGRVLDDDQMALADGYVIVSGDLFSEVPLVGEDLLPEGDALAFPTPRPPPRSSPRRTRHPWPSSSTFQEVFDHLDDGVVSMYVDAEALDGAAETLTTDLGFDGFDGSTVGGGQTGAVLRAEPSALELLAWSSVDVSTTATPAALAEGLPKSTVFALEVTGGADAVARQWQSVLDRVEDAGGSPASSSVSWPSSRRSTASWCPTTCRRCSATTWSPRSTVAGCSPASQESGCGRSPTRRRPTTWPGGCSGCSIP